MPEVIAEAHRRGHISFKQRNAICLNPHLYRDRSGPREADHGLVQSQVRLHLGKRQLNKIYVHMRAKEHDGQDAMRVNRKREARTHLTANNPVSFLRSIDRMKKKRSRVYLRPTLLRMKAYGKIVEKMAIRVWFWVIRLGSGSGSGLVTEHLH